ncbi:hypothetical protein IW146_000010 [Coemansia sp. RSA 922]|nr:hypothetical protein GGI08_000420 [Coemansia sp. S2]KAJ2118304.1 hypothetical protein IW146_000010 [Coemansia sp. RSA 922]KAJ2352115.1 hypothetical protein GGH92_001452 [Coemansia sp. RSA 2673]
MIYEKSGNIKKNSNDVEAGEIQEPLLKTRLDEIRRDVRASKSTWTDLRQKYPPGGSCFEPFNFLAISWSAIAKEDARGLGDDLDTDVAYSQAAAMAAYGVDILSSALSGPTVDRELIKQANNLFATLCATLMDTRDRHRDSVTKAVAEKIEAFSNILNGLNNTPQTEDTSSRMEGVEREEQSIDSHEVPRHIKVEQQYSPTSPQNEYRVSRSTTRDQQYSYSRGRSRSPDSRRPQPLRDPGAAVTNLRTLRPSHSLQDSRLPTQYSALLSLTTDHLPTVSKKGKTSTGGAVKHPMTNNTCTVVYRAKGLKSGMKLNRRTIIHNALVKRKLPKSAIAEYIDRDDLVTRRFYDKSWNKWVDWCEERGVDPTRKSVENLSERLSQVANAELTTSKIEPAVYSVWRAIEGDIQSREADH